MRTEVERLEKRIRERFVKAFATYRLLEDNDRVLVGLSGGKDSLCLLEMLAKRAKIDRPKFQVEAVHVRMTNIQYETSTAYLEHFCQQLNVPLHIVTTSFSPAPATSAPAPIGPALAPAAPATTLDGSPSGASLSGTSPSPSGFEKKPACFLCSWYRRKQLFNLAQQLGCNKIALGHHQDDLLHTCLMNLFYQGRFDTMPALLRMRKMPISIIRPLCMVEEADILRYAELRGYEKQVKLCPYEHDSHRHDMRQLFETLQQQNAETRHSLWNAIVRDDKLVQLS
jgi:tRNA(Ile)-lysidine synthase TilS/MesJ